MNIELLWVSAFAIALFVEVLRHPEFDRYRRLAYLSGSIGFMIKFIATITGSIAVDLLSVVFIGAMAFMMLNDYFSRRKRKPA